MKKLLQYTFIIFTGAILMSLMFDVKTTPVWNISSYEGYQTVGNYKLKLPVAFDKIYRMNLYLPRYHENNLDEVEYYCNSFNIRDNYVESDEFFAFTEVNTQLSINKFIDYVRYENKNILQPTKEQISPDEALKKAIAFIESRCISLKYDDTVVKTKDDKYEITFVERLGNYNKNDFNTKVLLDLTGRILSVDYYYLKYSIFDNCEILPLEQAVCELPVFSDQITITKAELVYIYDNSIMQPAYDFSGYFSNGDEFQYYVKASIYK